MIDCTALIKACPFATDKVKEWIKHLNQHQEFSLHRECASIEPSEDNIVEIIKQQGLRVKNKIGLTALEYLEQNPYAAENQIDQHKLMKKLVLGLMGEIIA